VDGLDFKNRRARPERLLLSMLLHVGLRSFIVVMHGVNRVCPCAVCMMSRLLVVSALVMLGCFGMMTRGMRMVLC